MVRLILIFARILITMVFFLFISFSGNPFQSFLERYKTKTAEFEKIEVVQAKRDLEMDLLFPEERKQEEVLDQTEQNYAVEKKKIISSPKKTVSAEIFEPENLAPLPKKKTALIGDTVIQKTKPTPKKDIVKPKDQQSEKKPEIVLNDNPPVKKDSASEKQEKKIQSPENKKIAIERKSTPDPEKKSEEKKEIPAGIKTKEGVPGEKIASEEDKKKAGISGETASIPAFYKGLYISNAMAHNGKKFALLRSNALGLGFNVLVIDVQSKPFKKNFLDKLKSEGFFPVARVVNFYGGLNTKTPSKERMDSLKASMLSACEIGFPEIQLDYIRFQDGGLKFKMSYSEKYKAITWIIDELKKSTGDCGKSIKFSADIFGRIPFGTNDTIGQNVEIFSKHLDALYPMLYPSHFYGQKKMINDPYKTVFEGVTNSKNRAGEKTRIIPFIQGFKMSVSGSKLSYTDYIKEQMRAAIDGGANGFIVWNAFNDYSETFLAMKKLKAKI